MLVDLGVLEQFPSNLLPGFTDALVELLPSLEDHACSLGRRGGFISRLRDGTWAGHIAEHVALELQNLAGTDVRHGKTRGAGPVGQYNVIYEYREESVGLEAGKIAVDLVNHLVDPTASPDFDLLAELERLIRLAERSAFGPSTQALIDEAVSRDIPYIRLDRHSLVQLGQGVHQQRIRATMTSRTSGIAVDIASDKSLTNRLLDSAGLPVPRSEVVDTEDDAVAAARQARLSRASSSRSTGTTAGASTSTSARRRPSGPPSPGALRESRAGDVVVETYVHGNDYRVLVIGGRLAAVAERVPASVVGDGEHTVRELVDIANADPRRGIGHEKVLTRIAIDDAAEALVRAQGLELDAVPERGRPGQARPHRQHVDRRHLDRPDAGGPPGQRRDRRDRGAGRRPRHRRHRLHLPGHRDARSARPAGRSSRSTPRPASGCTPTRPRASRSTSPGRSWTRSSRRARPRASRSSR